MKKIQQDKVLELLRNAGPIGVNSWDLTYIHSIKQAPTRIKELKEQGYVITSTPLSNRSVQYKLSADRVQDKAFRWDFSQGTARRVYE